MGKQLHEAGNARRHGSLPSSHPESLTVYTEVRIWREAVRGREEGLRQGRVREEWRKS